VPLGFRDTGAPRKVRAQRLVRQRIALLWEIADDERRGLSDCAAIRLVDAPSRRSSVDLPAPFGPTSPIRARGGTTRSTPARTTSAP
jgi:hypothetical protein